MSPAPQPARPPTRPSWSPGPARLWGLTVCNHSYKLSGLDLREASMEAHGIIVWLIIGAIAGWLAGLLVKGGGFGLIGAIIVGIVGALLGGWLAGVLGISIGSGFIASIITAVIGAVILLVILRAIKRA